MKRFNTGVFWLLSLLLAACVNSSVQPDYSARTYSVDSIVADSKIDSMIRPYRTEKNFIMSEVILELGNDLEKNRDNGSLGFWMCDALILGAKKEYNVSADIAILNHGGIRRPYVKKGSVTRGTVYELMPFENRVYVLKANAKQVQELAQEIYRRGGAPFSGMTITHKDESLEMKIGGTALKSEGVYTILCSDYQFNGGDQYGFLQKMEKVKELGLVRDLLIEGFSEMWAGRDSSVYNYKAERRMMDGQ